MSFVLLGILNSQASAGGFPIEGVTPDLWLDASDASTITESGGSVSQWNNKGSLENFTQATSADQPTTGVTTLNGLNVIDFANDWMTGSTKAQWKFLHDGTTYFMAAVVKYSNVESEFEPLFGNNATGGGNIGITKAADSRNDDNANEFLLNNGSSGDFPILIEDVGGITPNTFLIDSALIDPDNGTAANRISYFINNTEGTDTNTETATPSSSDPTFNLEIGNTGASATGTRPLNGSIAELIIVSGADATETNRQTVVDYLNDKWSVFV